MFDHLLGRKTSGMFVFESAATESAPASDAAPVSGKSSG